MNGQITLSEWVKNKKRPKMGNCSECCCETCLYKWSVRCPYGHCWDDYRAKLKPFNKLFPDQSPRKLWSNWKKSGEQAHWCRGGIFYPEHKCKHYVEYVGSSLEDCIAAPIQLFQDGYVICTLKDSIGCEACIAREEGKKVNDYACEFMRDTGCERMFTAKSLILDAMQEGENIEPCTEQCCIGCQKSCGFRCGQTLGWKER